MIITPRREHPGWLTGKPEVMETHSQFLLADYALGSQPSTTP